MKKITTGLGAILASVILFGTGTGTAHAGKYLQRVETSESQAQPKKKKAKAAMGKQKSSKSAGSKNDTRDEAFQKANAPKLSRDMVFTGTDINGKYLAAGELASTVETEKNLNRLIGMRKDFRDRLAAEKERLKAAGTSAEGN